MMPFKYIRDGKEAVSSKNELNHKLHFAKNQTKPESKNVQEPKHFTLLRLTKFKYQHNDN